jgi:hypothetical protein
MPQNILITPKSTEPKINFVSSGASYSSIQLNVLANASNNSASLSFEGSSGQLLSVVDNLSSGVIFAVGDVSGLPLISANADGTVKLAEYGTVVDVHNFLDMKPINASTVNSLRFYELPTNGTNFAAIRAPASIATDYTLTLPTTAGSPNQVLATDGTGALSWSGINITKGTVATAAATAAKTCTISGYTLATGDLLAITFTLGNTAASPTLSINGGAAIGIFLGTTAASALTFTVGAGATALLYYDGVRFQLTGSHSVSDANTIDRTIWSSAAAQAGAEVTAYKIVMEGSDGRFYPLSIGNTVAATKTVSTQPFLTDGTILWYASTATTAVNGSLSTIMYTAIPWTVLEYTLNQASGFTNQRAVYLVGTINSNGHFVLDNTSLTSFFTQTLPTTADGKVYKLLGYMYTATTSMILVHTHPMYEFKAGKLRPYTPLPTVSAADRLLGSSSTAGEATEISCTAVGRSILTPSTLRGLRQVLRQNKNVLTFNGTQNWNLADGLYHTLTATGNFTLQFPSNVTEGETAFIYVTLSGANRIISFASGFRAPGGPSSITLSTADGSVDRLEFFFDTATTATVTITKGIS